jgi:GntR family transcriptional regulator
MPVALLVRPGTDVPIYRQIVRQVIEAVATGELARGERMPSHRELAVTLAVAPLTIKKAYDELESAGFLTSRQGSGTFVNTKPAQPPASRARLAPLRDSARALAAESALHGLALEELLDLVRAAHARLENSR